MIVFISIAAVIIVIVTVLLCLLFRQRKYESFILQNSLCLKQLKEINERYNFYPQINFDQYHTYDNEKYYNTISCEDYLIYQLQFIGNKVASQIKKIYKNKGLYSDYSNEIKAITDFGKFQASTKKFKLEKLIEKEKMLFKKQVLSKPAMQFCLKVTLYCSKLNGYVYNAKTANFNDRNITILIKRLSDKRGTFYNDRGIWDSLCRVERGKVSNKMRFSIYERDGYRCRRCGVSVHGARLEIDHIIPIAKGGKSTYENLQTLCHKCNVEKGDGPNQSRIN